MKHAKKLLSLLLVLTMVFALSSTAFAAGTSTLTIVTTNGHTYSIYQLLKGDVSGLQTNGSGTLANVEAGANLEADTTVETFLEAIEGKSDAELGDTAFGYVSGNAKATVTGNGSTVETSVENGYYLVTDSYTGAPVTDGTDTISRYMVAVVGDTTMEPKVSFPSIDKKIIDTDANEAIDDSQKTDTAAIGDVIEYEITGKVPNTEGYKYYYYVVHDTLSEGLTLVEDSFEVTIGTKILTKGTDYYVYFDENNNSFDLALGDLKTLVDTEDNGVSVSSGISIKYKATVNDKAAIGTDPNTNTAQLEYSNNPGSSIRVDIDTNHPGIPNPGTATGEGPELITKTYVTELTILKVDENGKKLEGAEFTLTGDNLNKVIVGTNTTFRKAAEEETAKYYKLTNGTYTKTAPSTAAEGDEGYNADKYESTTPEYVRVTTVTTSTEATGTPKQIVGTVNAEGYVIFTGLNAGEYTLTETKTPEGYNTIDPIVFTISSILVENSSTANMGGSITWSSNNTGIVLDAANGVFDATIQNVPGTPLPSTGGMGTKLFYLIGGVLVLGAAVLLIARRRMNASEK